MSEGVLKTIFIVGLVVASVARGKYSRKYRKSAVAVDHKSALDMAMLGLASAGLVILPLVYVFSPWLDFADYGLTATVGWTLGTVGAVVFAFAIWLLWRSHVDLGRNFSPLTQIMEGHTLVTGGVYRRIRHPMYTAHWVWAVAQALLLQNWIAGPALLVTFLPVCLVRIPREEQMMLAQFGEEYRTYMSQTGRIIPVIPRVRKGHESHFQKGPSDTANRGRGGAKS